MERQKKKIVVLDASVVVKWYVAEEFTNTALKIRDDYSKGIIDIWSTELLPFEVLNALRYNSELGRDQIRKAGQSLSKFKLALHPILDGLLELSLENATKYGLTVYDSSYMALSQAFDKKLYTADEKMLSKISDKEHVIHLKDYSV